MFVPIETSQITESGQAALSKSTNYLPAPGPVQAINTGTGEARVDCEKNNTAIAMHCGQALEKVAQHVAAYYDGMQAHPSETRTQTHTSNIEALVLNIQ